ncbi:uncharacterized protein LOC116260957 isoform X2 [Nymphaea colorata]|uniref:uncharacterized protein LOC116260957 isoform X2 n=1 Tax=Nymphaea colorata TaxID=210225 RepID=UPI00129EE81D|nr:uncharacterized protein LOC116260957 isoform X2 [Nymphaea colorata]
MACTFNHGSHDHPLEIMGTMEINVREAKCRACGLSFRPGDDLFGCRNCGFFLHRPCGLMPPSLAHPFHQKHQLQLRYRPAYNDGIFYCDICGKRDTGFNYRCQTCNFDAHLPCVNLPLRAQKPNHRKHQLKLLFRAPAGTSCRVCRREIRHCCYSCSDCFSSIFVHVGCSNTPRDGGNTEDILQLLRVVTKVFRIAFRIGQFFGGNFAYDYD